MYDNSYSNIIKGLSFINFFLYKFSLNKTIELYHVFHVVAKTKQ